MKIFGRELAIYLILLLVLALYQHPDLLTSPTHRLGLAIEKGAFIHQFLWTTPIYLLGWVIRIIILNPLLKKIKAKQTIL